MSYSNTDTGSKPADPYTQKNLEDPSLKEKVEDLVAFVDKCKFCMMTTRIADSGLLVSRCMALAAKEGNGIDLIFHTNTESGKTDDLQSDPDINLGFVDPSGQWASISGIASIETDREKVRKYYSPALKAWLGDLGDGKHDGGPEDPRIGLIKVNAKTVQYAVSKRTQLGGFVELAKGIATGSSPDVNKLRHLDENELKQFNPQFARSYATNTWPYLYKPKDDKMAPQLDGYFKQVDGMSDHFIERLRKAVAIPSVSADDERRPDVVRMGQFLADELKALGAEVEQRPLGKQPHKEHLDLPPVVIARYGNDEKKRTILVYGHYDVQPALMEDGWATKPFDLTVDEKGRMFGRGSTDDKGPVLGWLNSIEAHQKAGIDFPVNLLMCFEGMEEYGSEGLDDFINAEAKKYFADADAVCISDNYWLGTEKPCLTYGLRGCSYYSIEISGPGQDLHSGVFGGTAQEPMTDLVRVMSSLVDTNGKILIPGLSDLVAPLTDEEKSLYGDISFTMDNLYESLGSKTGIYDDKERTLMARWRYPSLSLHGVEGAFSAPGAKTVIPAKVIGKFSIRTVPNMEPADVDKLVYKYVDGVFASLKSKNTCKVSLQHAGKWWVASPRHWNFTAAGKAVEKVWGVKPDLTREGGSIPVTLTFEQATGKNVLLLPMGSSTDAAHSINEKLDKRNYIEGIKLLGAYLHYVAEEPMKVG